MPVDISISDLAINLQLATWLKVQRSYTGAGGARQLIESQGFTIGDMIERGRIGTVPQWSAYDIGEAVVVLVDGMWTPQQAAAFYAGAGLPPVPFPTANVNGVAGGDAFTIWERLNTVWAGRSKRLVLCGYSYGGCLVEIVAALTVGLAAFNTVEVCSFGAPRPGDSALSRTLEHVNIHRWMNDTDPVPRFPPHLNESSAAIVAVGPFTAAVWQQYTQPAGGLMLTAPGAFQQADVPTGTIPHAEIDLALWLFGADQGKVAGHSLELYVDRLKRVVANSERGEKGSLQGSAAEPFFPATQQAFNAASADIAALTSTQSAIGGGSMPYIPVQDRPKAVVIAGSYYVVWEGQLICQCPTKSSAKTTAKYLFKWLRVLQTDAITSVGNSALAWSAFWAIAVSSSAGFDPPFQISP